MNLKLCIDDLLMHGCDDWVDACEVTSVVISVGGIGIKSPDEIRELSLELIRAVVRQGLMELGDLESGEGFRKWDLSIEEGLSRVERDWTALGRNPTLWEVCWLNNTERGEEIGERVLAAWRESRNRPK